MYSKAKIAGHPIHPMLVGFPITFYTVSFIAYTYYQFSEAEPVWYQLAYGANVLGVATALLAAIPGFIDWAFGVPRHSAAKKHGLVHMSLNVLALVLFALNALLYRGSWNWNYGAANTGYAIVLTGVAFIVTAVAGTYGWMLVSRHKVGVELTPEQELLEPVTSPRPRTVYESHESSHIPV